MKYNLSRSEREKKIYNEGLKRAKLDRILSHSSHGPASIRKNNYIFHLLYDVKGKNVLELGSSAWVQWLKFTDVSTLSLNCINISEKELRRGIELAHRKFGTDSFIKFSIMDAHQLNFWNESQDIVFGSGILHHLKFRISVDEIYRVLKPGGTALFFEPLRLNPISMIVRKMTPFARTIDERPLGKDELNYFNMKFSVTKNHYYELFTVPAGVVSLLLFSNHINILTNIADRFDLFLEKNVPIIKPLFRYVLLVGTK